MSAEKRASYLEKAKLATLVANEANERRIAWDMLMNALNRLQLAYDGNQMKDRAKEWYNEIALEAAARRRPLSEIAAQHRAEAQRMMDLYDSEPGF